MYNHVVLLQRSVLIETLWNVKLSAENAIPDSFPVLIETLWNVKFAHQSIPFAVLYLVLIETLWNVKVKTVRDIIQVHVVLIETLWNVKHELPWIENEVREY